MWKTNYRYNIFFLILLLALINYIDRGALSYSGEFIINEYGLNKEQWGNVLGFFGYGYMFGALFGGLLSDKFGPKKVWLIAGISWSIFESLTAFAGNIGMMFFGGSVLAGFALMRILFGLTEGPVYCVINKTISSWAAPKERGFVVSMGLLSTPLGALLTAPVAVFLLSYSGSWRVTFIVLGMLGIIVLYFLMRIMTDHPCENPKVSKEELAIISQKEIIEEKSQSGIHYHWWHFFRSRTLMLNTAGYFAFNYVNFLLLTWTPKYLQDVFGYNLFSLWYMGMIPWIGACITILLGGKISDLLLKKTGSARIARGYFAAGLLLLTTLSFLCVGFSSSVIVAIVMIAVGNALNSFANTVYWTVVIDTSPKQKVGTFSGMMHFFGNIASILAPSITGVLVSSNGYNAMFVVASVVTCIGMICMLLVKPGKF
ncbi:MFS transporter [Helicobacter cappadocius]|uniref:MFS transporter n=1 Tax=Helicobacter cappadocius TaxID=3063998 RepID=A0AA90Q2K3_9HELI|nr:MULTISPECIES: MFS transporter [unclassified Helicobacter]MDO7252904.1 MFS transporter [Helicobacter sp. faydin-H75]MDP2538948.1 MFS transporter [Helicobacter sp. faydin-H76]